METVFETAILAIDVFLCTYLTCVIVGVANAYYTYMIRGDVLVHEDEPVQELEEPQQEPAQEPDDPDSPHIYMKKIRSCDKLDSSTST